MQSFLVSLDIQSDQVGVGELMARLKLWPTESSHDRDSMRPSVWRVFSTESEEQGLETHFRSLVKTWRKLKSVHADETRKELSLKVSLTIAVMFDTANSTIVISHDLIEFANKNSIDIIVVNYPCG